MSRAGSSGSEQPILLLALGKSLWVEHWEETCDYYIKQFTFDTYGRKWLARKGQAIHTQSDFMRPLYEWGGTLFANADKNLMSRLRNPKAPAPRAGG